MSVRRWSDSTIRYIRSLTRDTKECSLAELARELGMPSMYIYRLRTPSGRRLIRPSVRP